MHLLGTNGHHSLQLTMTSNSAQLMNFNTIMFGIKERFVESKCNILEANVDECLAEEGNLRVQSDTIPPPSVIILKTHFTTS